MLGQGEPEGAGYTQPSEGICGSPSLRFRMRGILVSGAWIDSRGAHAPDPQLCAPVVGVAHTVQLLLCPRPQEELGLLRDTRGSWDLFSHFLGGFEKFSGSSQQGKTC